MEFGYEGVEFGVFFNHGGRVVIEELVLTTPAAGAESTTITIDGTGFTVPLTSGTLAHNAFEITESLNSQVALYNFTQNGATVVARSIITGAITGSFLFASPGAAEGAWVPVNTGLAATVEFTKQSEWSESAVLGSTLDPLKLNRYKVVFNGSIDYFIEDGLTGRYVLVHRRVHTNVETTPMFSVASFRVTWAVSNLGNTTNHSVFGSEASAFNQGVRKLIGATKGDFNTTLAVGGTTTNILSIRCREVFGDKVNLGRIIPTSITAFTDGIRGAIVQVCIGMTFATEPNFSYRDKGSSIAEVEKSQIEVSGGNCIAVFVIGQFAPSPDPELDILLLPGEILTIAMNVPSGGAADMNSSMIWKEDK